MAACGTLSNKLSLTSDSTDWAGVDTAGPPKFIQRPKVLPNQECTELIRMYSLDVEHKRVNICLPLKLSL